MSNRGAKVTGGADLEDPELAGLDQALFQLERSRTPQAMNEVVGILADALKDPAHAELQRAFLVFLLRGLLPARLPGVELPAMNDLSEVHAMLSERVKECGWKSDPGLPAPRPTPLLCRRTAPSRPPKPTANLQ